MTGSFFGNPIWPDSIVAIAMVVSFLGGLIGLIGGLTTSGHSYPDSYLEQNFSTLRTATPARRLGGSLLDGLLLPLTLFIGWLIWFIIVAPRGQTPGKSLVSTYVLRRDGTRAGGWLMWGREVGVKWFVIGFIDVFLLGMAQLFAALWILWDRDNQCLWDKIVGSYVVYSPLGVPGEAGAASDAETAGALRELQALHTDGVISADEYEARRRRLMGESSSPR